MQGAQEARRAAYLTYVSRRAIAVQRSSCCLKPIFANTPSPKKLAFRRINATLGEKSRRWVVLIVRPIGGSFVSGSSCRLKPILLLKRVLVVEFSLFGLEVTESQRIAEAALDTSYEKLHTRRFIGGG